MKEQPDKPLSEATPEDWATIDHEREQLRRRMLTMRAQADQSRALLVDNVAMLKVIRQWGTAAAADLFGPELTEAVVKCMAATLYADIHEQHVTEAIAELDGVVRQQRRG